MGKLSIFHLPQPRPCWSGRERDGESEIERASKRALCTSLKVMCQSRRARDSRRGCAGPRVFGIGVGVF